MKVVPEPKTPSTVLGVKKPSKPVPVGKVALESTDLGLVFVRSPPQPDIIFVVPESALERGDLVHIHSWVRNSIEVGVLGNRNLLSVQEFDRPYLQKTQSLVAKFGLNTELRNGEPNALYAQYRRPDLAAEQIPLQNVGRIHFYDCADNLIR